MSSQPAIPRKLLSLTTLVVLGGLTAMAQTGCDQPEEERKEKPRESRKISAVSFVSYMNRMHRRIKAHWLAKTDNGDSGCVAFVAHKAGDISDLKIFKSSGNQVFDAAMLESVKAAQPLPPLPQGAPESIPVEFTFDHRVFNHLLKDEPEELKKEVEKLSQQIAITPLAELYLKRGKILLHLEEKTRAVEDFALAIKASKEFDDKDNLKSASSKSTEFHNHGKANSSAKGNSVAPDAVALAQCRKANDALAMEALTLKAQTDSALGNYKECLADTDEILHRDGKNLEAFILASDAHLNCGHLDLAFEAANRAIEAAPNNPDGYTARAYAYNLSFKYKKAIEDCDKAIALDPHCQAAYAYRGDAEEELKLYDQAMKDYNKNIELNPLDAATILRRAELHNQMGHFHRAIIDCTDAIKLDPDNGEAYFYRSFANEQLSLASQAQKDKDRAEALGFVGQ